MNTKKALAIFSVPVAAALLAMGAAPANATTVDDTKDGGYVIVDPDAAQVTAEGVFFPTGKISANTVVVISKPDGSLPNGLSDAKLTSLYGERRALPESAQRESAAPARVSAAAASNYSYVASSASSWSRAFAGPNIIGADAGVKVKYRFTVASSTAQTNAGQGLGYYRGYSGSEFGTWSKWYNLGVADSRTPGSTSVPWGNVAAQAKFRAKCATSTLCGGSFSASGV
ncbi:hypothetical protein I8920_07900 [Curtobacterium sp. YC1]|uniref:hypothetical protein n=1 Tax=Curtobacterium sp. YC1 TaxID=2795488 RepID=UPI0018E520C7|nr:hypothetical protein [Curtobacterium sp. YC1]QQD74827.1 hypothetical protein I8920_07900 [Curtobacterium sp. YC1]